MQYGNLSAEELQKSLLSTREGERQIPEAVMEKLSDEKKKELFRILNDKKELEKLLSSEKAQRLMKKFGMNG